MRPALIAIVAYLLLSAGGSALPLAVALPEPGPAVTPSCPATGYPGSAALLIALQGADYACAEEIAAALRQRVGLSEADTLLAMAGSGSNSLIRRNAVRTLGRLAEAPRGSRARELVLRARAATTQRTLAAILEQPEDNFLTQDAIWLLDSFFYPTFSAALGFERVAATPGLAPALRYRAAAARGRLVFARPGALDPADRNFILAGLRSDDPGVRTAAAAAVARLRADQLAPALGAEFQAALEAAWAAEPPLSLAPDQPTDPTALTFVESSPSSLTARAAIARAKDRLTGGAAHLAELRASYETLALPNTLAAEGIVIRSGLPPERLPALRDEVFRTRSAFFATLGPSIVQPLPGEGEGPLNVLIFARQGIFRDYVRAFTNFTVDIDGVYDETTATLFSFERTPEQSDNTLVETLRHEATHFFTGRYLFQGRWLTPGYHNEPKGWFDEGLAELFAGLDTTGTPLPRTAQLRELCTRGLPPALSPLLDRREGYDRFGSFDYGAAWAFSYYLFSERPQALQRIALAYRDGSYRRADVPRLAGASLAQLETTWHRAMAGWCSGS